MSLVFKVLAAVFLLIAVLAAVTDGTRTMAAHTLVVTSLLDHWAKLAPQLFASAQSSIRRIPLLWDVLVRPFLLLPAWGLFGVLGCWFAWLGRRRHKVNIFAN